jgi:hypothetical protein
MRDRRGFLRRGVGLVAAAPFARLAGAAAAEVAPPARVDAGGPLLGPLLAKNRDRHPGIRLSNHLSMALLSLSALGGAPDKIRAIGEARLRERDFAPFPTAGAAVPAAGWRDHLGNFGALFGLRALFTREIAARGLAPALRLYLPGLLPALGAHAFHAMIRTAYGVRFGDDAEVAMGLAYWAAHGKPLAPLGAPGAERDPAAALDAVRATPGLTGRKRPSNLNIAEQISWVAAQPGFAAAASALRVHEGSLDAISAAMARYYLARQAPGKGDDFTALHAVTGTHAYRVLEPHLPDRLAGRRYLWQALVAGYLGSGAPALPTPPPADAALPSWDEVAAKAAASFDDHDFKLVEIAGQELRRTGDRSYLRAAAFRLRLV